MIAQLQPLYPRFTAEFLPGYHLPPVPKTSTRIILLRHGRSTLNDEGRYQGSSDQSELTAKGIRASQKIGQLLQNCSIDAVYVSPLKRAQDTLAALLPHLTSTLKRVATTPLLREIDLPNWEGLRYEEVRLQQSNAYRCWREKPEQFQMVLHSPGNGGAGRWNQWNQKTRRFYPVQELYQRARQFWQQTLPRHQGQTLLVVSHGGTNQALINIALGLPPRQHHALQQTHSGLTVLDCQASRCSQTRLHVLNLALNDRLPKLKSGKQGLRLLLLPCQANIPPDPTLTHLLKGTTIQAAIVEGWENSNSIRQHYPCYQAAESLLKYNPETVILSVQRSHFWQQWQTAIHHSPKNLEQTGLTTVLAITQSKSLHLFLKTLLALPKQSSSLSLQANTLTAVHYPNVQKNPILQGLNLSPIPLL